MPVKDYTNCKSSSCSDSHINDDNSNKKTYEKILKNFNYIDKIYLPSNKPAIREIIDINLRICNIKKNLIKTCNNVNLSIKGYKIIRINYEGLNCYGRIVTATFATPFFEIIPVHSFDNIVNVTNNICYSCADLANRRLIYIYNILSFTACIESTDNFCNCNVTPIYDTDPIFFDENSCLDNNCFSNAHNCNYNWQFRNDFL